MRFTPICLLLMGLMVSHAAEQLAKPTATDKPNALQDAAIAAIKKLGGYVIIGKKSPGGRVTQMLLRGLDVTDAGLVHLKELTSLQMLNLSNTKVTDAGVKELQAAFLNCRIKW